MGITDEDLKYITETSSTDFRISIPAFDKRRTKLVHNLLEAIRIKYEMLEQIEIDQKEIKEKEETINESKGKITKYNLVSDGNRALFKGKKKRP